MQQPSEKDPMMSAN